jgi:hypothetical protein
MALIIAHAKTNDIADWTQADLDAQTALGNYPPGTVLADIVLPSDWNANHVLSGSIAWGEITGSISSQTDLQTALNAKAPLASPTFTGTVTLPAGQIVNGVTLSAAQGTSNFLRGDGTYAVPVVGFDFTIGKAIMITNSAVL